MGMPGWNNGGRAAVWSLRTGALGELSSVSCTVNGRISDLSGGKPYKGHFIVCARLDSASHHM